MGKPPNQNPPSDRIDELPEKTFAASFSSDSVIQIELPSSSASEASISTPLLIALFRHLHSLRASIPGFLNLHLAYRSLSIDFDPFVFPPKQAQEFIEKAISDLTPESESASQTQSTVIEIPVIYGGDFGPDLESLSQVLKLSVEEIIRLHTEPIYEVAFLGFAPGFPYLKGLNDRLTSPRKSVPRLKVEKGSVAIGGSQTGIYPEMSPGGWQIIGRTTLELFDPHRTPPTTLLPGDRLRFVHAHQVESK